jgi:hypothetical protein
MVGSGSVVTKDVPSYGLVAGNPAKLRGFICPCGEKLLPKEMTPDVTILYCPNGHFELSIPPS